ncbi:MAG: hypothetical protein ACLQJ0_00100 [Steroidobacteraceae bacterium]
MQLFNSPKTLSDQRDRSVLEFLLPPKVMPQGVPPLHEIDEVRIAVLWGIDRDLCMVAILAAMYLRNRDMLERIVAVRQERGKVDFWCRTSPDVSVKDVRLALEDAVQAVMFQRWTVRGGVALPCDGEIVDWQKLPDGDPLRGVARSYGLGVHRKAARRNGAQS